MGKNSSPVTLLLTIVILSLLVFLYSCPARSFIRGAGNDGEGILETEDISVVLQGSGLWIRITPMEDEILRYCTEDTRRTYSKMIDTQGESLKKDGESNFIKFLVLFQGRSENETYFDPTELNISHQGKLYKPEKILPISSTFDKRILKLYETPEMAIYAFNKEIDLDLSLRFQYKDLNSNKWDEIIKTVEDAKLQVR
jgi:hypothetical protein